MMQELQSLESINRWCCCCNFRKIMRAVTQLYDRYFEPIGIRATQFTLLVALSATNAKTLTEIAEGLVMDRTTLTRNLKPLEKMDLIVTVKTLDKRSKAYALTDKGRSVVDRCIPVWQELQKTVISGLGEERYETIISDLEQIIGITNEAAKKK